MTDKPERWTDEWLLSIRAKYATFYEGVEGTSIYLRVVRAIAREAFEEAANQRKKIPPAHTYASENADVYRAYDAGADKMESLIRARAKEVSGGK